MIGKVLQAGRAIEGAGIGVAIDHTPESIVGNATQLAIGAAAIAFLPEEVGAAIAVGGVAALSLLGATIAQTIYDEATGRDIDAGSGGGAGTGSSSGDGSSGAGNTSGGGSTGSGSVG